MITITKKAAEEISLSTHNPETQGLIIRFAADQTDEGFQYLMGFDERHDGVHLYLRDPQGIRQTRVQLTALNDGDGGSDCAPGTPKSRV